MGIPAIYLSFLYAVVKDLLYMISQQQYNFTIAFCIVLRGFFDGTLGFLMSPVAFGDKGNFYGVLLHGQLRGAAGVTIINADRISDTDLIQQPGRHIILGDQIAQYLFITLGSTRREIEEYAFSQTKFERLSQKGNGVILILHSIPGVCNTPGKSGDAAAELSGQQK